MNVSPHHQRPTRYPWPGQASTLAVVLGVVVVLVIGFMLITSPANEAEEPSPTGMGAVASDQVAPHA